ncbi:NAD(P)H-dependent oxidoreductase [Methylophilus sp. Leaf414]|uniref:NAD(P)H-dependent oxidoreductase n=1 Tax=Methylophilus sp. Leaf414 TaxID=1736371 RepID=UPI0006F28828|nr:NAD(P)H-dependent oxidoreductase [Methylophilus sp. Leaf414]KQT34179.1 NAD(P)H-dependent oxidoreductase [Methylophilus sp. Leaf414]
MIEQQAILDAFQFRHACKEFDASKQIPAEEFELILESARLSPSSFGFEPWHFIVVQDKALRESLKQHAWGAPLKLDTASHFVLCLAMKSPFLDPKGSYLPTFMREVQQHPQEVADMRLGFYSQFQQSDFDLTDDRKLFDWASKQCYIPLANMMTVAAMRGIDSCPIEGFKQKETDALLAEQFGVNLEEYGLAYMVAFGYRKVDPRPKTRRDINQVVTWK